MKEISLSKCFLVFLTLSISTFAQARDTVRMAGSSTVFPFAAKVAEVFGQTSSFNAPIYESTGTGGGMKRICVADGVYDIAGASRRIKDSELEQCIKAGIELIELEIGIDGLSIANSRQGPQMSLTNEQVFLALASEVPYKGKIVPNPYKKWSDIDKSLPNIDILVYGPPSTSGTRDSLVSLIMQPGAKKLNVDKSLGKILREDGFFQEMGENDNLIVKKLINNPSALGVFGFLFLEENLDVIQGVHLDGKKPTFENIMNRKYPAWRPLFLYVKKGHIGIIPGLVEYAEEVFSDKASGEDGYLVDMGLIPFSSADRTKQKEKLDNLVVYKK